MPKYKNVVFVCTVRNEFVSECLPASADVESLSNFEEGLEDLIDAYFFYFGISRDSCELPLNALSYPLFLRLYCETVKKSQDQNLRLDIDSLPSLLRVYFEFAADRIFELSRFPRRIHAAEVLEAIRKVAELMWLSNVREVSSVTLKDTLDGRGRIWDESIVKALESEGIIIKSITQSSPVYSFSFDMVAGYAIANYLVASRSSTDWLIDIQDQFQSQNPHPLNFDILVSLVEELPRSRGRDVHVWKYTSGTMQKFALIRLIDSTAALIDDESVKELKNILVADFYNPHAMSLLLKRRMSTDHPFNAVFIHSVLAKISCGERDITWGKWIYENRDFVLTDVISICSFLQQPPSAAKAKLLGIWVMWLTASSCPIIRDKSSRAISLLGLHSAFYVYELVILAKVVDDPYVLERVLAATYDLALRIVRETNAEAKNALLTFSKQFFSGLEETVLWSFRNNVFIQQYTLGLLFLIRENIGPVDAPLINLDMAKQSRNLPQIINPEIISQAGEHSLNSDFCNYVLGYLLPDWSTYNFTNSDYLELKTRLIKIMLSLGYDFEGMSPIDASIRRYPYSGSHAIKVERLGKKYSWMAYFELVGQSVVHCESRFREIGRDAHATIDPTFPDAPRKISLNDTRVLFSNLDLEEWLEAGRDCQ